MTGGTGHRRYPFADVPGLSADPAFDSLRERGPVQVRLPFGEPAWLATRHADVKAVLTDSRFSRARSVASDEPRMVPSVQRINALLNADPPEHARLRAAMTKAFSRRAVERLRPKTRLLVSGLLDRMIAGGSPADLMAAVAAPLPALVLCDVLGVPEVDRVWFTEAAVGLLAPALAGKPEAEIRRTGGELWAYFAKLMTERRAKPGADLISDLLTNPLSDHEILALCVTVVVAGHDATTMQLGNFTYQLLTHSGAFERLVAEPTLVPAAVDELMRYSPLGISTAFPRVATEDIDLGGVLIRAGEAVIVALTAANHDAAVFARPADLDLDRRQAAHLSFGHGLHRCLGARLATMELQVVLGALVRRLPCLRLEGVDWSRGLLARSAETLMVTWKD